MSTRPLRDTGWSPPKHRALLKVGAKVRLRMHSECPRRGVLHGWDVEALDGQETTIIGVQKDWSDHPYIVTIDGHMSYHAAAELEPLAAPDAAHDPAGGAP